VELSKKERLILVNQLLIIEKLYPEEASHYARHRQALEEGYELHYGWIYERLWDGLSKEECRKVLDILDMYRALSMVEKALADKEFEGKYWLRFKGFDGNNESEYLAYSRYFIVDLGRFDELRYGQAVPDFNSHLPSMPKYSAMLDEWDRLGRSFNLTVGDAVDILSAKAE